jgi:MFS transporter, ACS family, tartrate transporter
MSQTFQQDKTLEATTMRRVSWRLMPFLTLAYLLCYIDRVNVGFASLQMNKAVGIDPKTYGLGAGIFFIGYFILRRAHQQQCDRHHRHRERQVY